MTMTHSPAPATSDVAPAAEYSVENDPMFDVNVWELTDRERVIYELGFHMGYAARQPELDELDHEADRLYMAAFDHRNCTCWRGRRHNVTWTRS